MGSNPSQAEPGVCSLSVCRNWAKKINIVIKIEQAVNTVSVEYT